MTNGERDHFLPLALVVFTGAAVSSFMGFARYMLLRPTVRLFADVRGRLHDAAVGFAGGLVGGLTAMPGAFPTIWCDLRGLPKECW
jgi:hypothetical protein